MMNSMMRGMFHDPMMIDPFGSHGGMMTLSPYMGGHHRAASAFNPSAMQSFTLSASPGSSGYYSSSVTTMSTGPDGRPQVYQESSSQLYAPGGVRETRQSVRDSRTGHQAMSIGHHIRDRGHVMKQARNAYTGEREEDEEFINLDQEQGERFEDEFRTRFSHGRRHHVHESIEGHRRHHRANRDQLALPAPRATSDPEPIIEFPPDSPPPTASSSRCPSRGSTPGKERRSKKREKKPYKK